MSLSINNLSKVRRTEGEELNSSSASAIRYLAVRGKNIPAAVRWSFLSFVATFPFDAAETTLMAGTLSPAKISGYVFFVFYLFYYSPFSSQRSFPRPPGAMWWFLGYVTVYALNGFFLHEDFVDHFRAVLFTLLQLLVLCWIASDLLEDQKMARNVLLTYSIASVMLALGTILGVPGLSVDIYYGRLTALGANPNAVGTLMALAGVTLIGLSLSNHVTQFHRKLLLGLLVLPLLVVMVNTGSRAAMLAFIMGCSAYLLPYWRSRRALISIVSAVVGILAVVYTAARNPDFLERWELTYYEGHLSSRDKIFPAAIEMFLERPILGWQPVELWHELGFRSGFGWRMSDAHNLYLHLLLEVGLVGAIPFFIGLGLCGRSAWRGRRASLGLLPLALLLTVFTSNMSGTDLKSKPFWLVLALNVGAGSAAAMTSGHQSYMFLVRRSSTRT